MRMPLRLLPRRTVLTVRRGLNRGVKWVTGSSTHGCWLGTYEFEKQMALQRFVKAGMQIFDIGANAGFYTLAFSRLCGDRGKVWAFEPFAENVTNLLRHVELNGLGNVTLFQVAVAEKRGMTGFRISESNAMGKLSDNAENYLVPTVCLDDLLIDCGLPVPDLIKMDVEGAESLVLEGATKLLGYRKTILFVALHGDDQWRKCKHILETAGYELFLLNGDKVTGKNAAVDEIYAVPVV